MGDHVEHQPGGVGGEAPRGEVVEPDPVLEVADHVFDHGVAAVVGFELDGGTVPVGDEGVMVVGGEQGELAARGGLDSPHDEAHLRVLVGEGPPCGLGHVGAVADPVRDRRPVLVGDGDDHLVEALVHLDGDGVAHACVGARVGHLVVVEPRVGPQHHRPASSGAPHPVKHLGHKARRAPPGDHLVSTAQCGDQRVVAAHLGVPEPGALFGQTVGLADRGVDVHGHRAVARAGPGGPCPAQRLVEDPVELGDMPPGETAQERAQRGGRPDRVAEHLGSRRHAHPVRVVDAVPAGQRRVDQRHRFEADVGVARRVAEVDAIVEQLAQPEMLSQGGRGDQPGVGHGVVVVEGHRHPVEGVA